MGCIDQQLLGVAWGTYLDVAIKKGLAEEMLFKPNPEGREKPVMQRAGRRVSRWEGQ